MTKDELVEELRKAKKRKRQPGMELEVFPILEDIDKHVLDAESEYESEEEDIEDKTEN